jgi:hypothetical protein
MTLAILITIGVIIYFIVGRTILIVLDDKGYADTEEWRGVAIVIFPLVCLWVLFMESSEYLADEFKEIFKIKSKNNW